jgi:hypothetical protein
MLAAVEPGFLHRAFLVGAAGLSLALGVALRAPSFAAFALALLLLVFLARAAAGRRLARLEGRRSLAPGAFEGEEVRVEIALENRGRAPVSLVDQALVADYMAQCRQYSVSLSSFQVFLGLREDLVRKVGIPDSEVFYEPSYDPESSYARMLKADVEDGGVFVTLYDNIYDAYSPAGKNTVNIMTLQGYDHWERFERGYHAGEKREYRKE